MCLSASAYRYTIVKKKKKGHDILGQEPRGLLLGTVSEKNTFIIYKVLSLNRGIFQMLQVNSKFYIGIGMKLYAEVYLVYL